MAKCNLSIEIPGNEDFVAPGGELDVIVHVSCDSKTKCNGLSLTRGWRTHGRGNRVEGGKRMEELFRGTWEAGDYAYPTKVRFPRLPMSYHGKVINVDWYLKARADVPLAFDPKAEQMVLLVDPDPPAPYVPPEIWAPKPIKLSAGVSGSMIASMIAIPFVVVLLFASSPKWSVLLIPLAAYLIVGFRRGKAAVSAMGHVAIEVHPPAIKPGEEMHVMVEFHPEQAVQLEHMTVTLTASEEATSGSGTNTTTFREQVFQDSQVLGQAKQVSATDPVDVEAVFELPVTAPPSLDENDNKVTTTLKLEIQPSGQKPLSHEQVITVGPQPTAAGE